MSGYEWLGMIAVVWLVMAVTLAVAAVVMHRRFDVPAVRRALNGTSARQEIAWLRGIRPGAWRYADILATRDARRASVETSRPAGSAQASTSKCGAHTVGAVASTPVVAADRTMLTDGTVVSDGTMLSDGTVAADDTVVADGTVVSDSLAVFDDAVMAGGRAVSDDTVSDDTVSADNTVVAGGIRRRAMVLASAAVAMAAMGVASSAASAADYHTSTPQTVTAVRTFAVPDDRRTIPIRDAASLGQVSYQGDDSHDLRNGNEVIAWGEDTSRRVRIIMADGYGQPQAISLTGSYLDLDGEAQSLQSQDYRVTTVDSAEGRTGSAAVEVTLITPGSYDFSDIAIHMGGDATSYTIGNLDGSDRLPQPLTIGEPAGGVAAALTAVTSSGDTKGPWYAEAPKVGFTVTGNRLLPRILEVLQQQDATSTAPVVTAVRGKDPYGSITIGDLRIEDDGRIGWADTQSHADGWYRYTVHERASEGIMGYLLGTVRAAELDFGVDTIAPTMQGVSALPPNTTYDGQSIHAAVGERTIGIIVDDASPAADAESPVSGAGTLRAVIPAPTDLYGNVIDGGTPVEQHIAVDPASGQAVITFSQEGLYELDAVRVMGMDQAGNTTETTLRALLSETDASILVVIAPGAPQVDTMTLTDRAPEHRRSTRQGYYRGDVSVTCTVHDPWFPLGRNATDATTVDADLFAESTVEHSGHGRTLEALTIRNKGWNSQDGMQWSITVPVRVAGARSVSEGRYAIGLSYQGLHDAAASATISEDMLMDGTHFIIDWTAPNIGTLTLAGTPTSWHGIMFAASHTVTLDGLSDALSGVDADSPAFAEVNEYGELADGDGPNIDAHTTGATLGNDDLDYDPIRGTLSFRLEADGFRLIAEGTALAVADAAGNYASTGDFSDQPVFAEHAIDMLAVDASPPEIAVSYDNNEVRNERYYRAWRNGTLTLSDANLDLVIDRDPDRVLVSLTRDGSEHRAIPLSALTPGDDGRTYGMTFAAQEDGVWSVDAEFHEPAPETETAAHHDRFIIDTTPPQLGIAFDNTDVANGMYYDAPRTATITQIERNLSESESVISISATDGNGNEQPVPAGGGWMRADGERHDASWTNTVTFSGEGHYTMEISAIDLAGNKAQTVTVPEFVIDLTPPHIAIDRVSDGTAYAGTVAPSIECADANLGEQGLDYTIEGVHRGPLTGAAMPGSLVRESEGRLTVTFRDFERTPDTDDVYTLTATATDKAGNVAETAITFSVNRFGSTYVFNAGTRQLRGAYLQQAQDVEIQEINVSGLAPSEGRITVVANDKADTLAPGEFGVRTDDDAGWSRTVYTIPAQRFDGDGFYRILVQSVDLAGNVSQNTMEGVGADHRGNAEVNFAIDATAPTVYVPELEAEDGHIGHHRRRITIDAKDNLAVNRTELYIDGRKIREWNTDTSLDDIPQYTLQADGRPHAVMVRVTDRAGNQTTAVYDADNGEPVHPWLLLVLPAIAGIAVAGWGIRHGALRRRRT